VGVATLLYCDSRNAIKPGAAASVDRLSDVLMQLDRTYDIYGMTADALLPLLPREFDGFRRAPRRPRTARPEGRALACRDSKRRWRMSPVAYERKDTGQPPREVPPRGRGRPAMACRRRAGSETSSKVNG
jgi:hypothetical protein